MTIPVTFRQLTLLPDVSAPTRVETSSTFGDNMSLPVHRWFRYSAGFSALWVRELLLQAKAEGRHHVLDPFAGSGTVPLEATLCGLEAMGLEAHPFVLRIAQAKLAWHEDVSAFATLASSILARARSTQSNIEKYPKLILQCYPPDTLARLDTLRSAWEIMGDDRAASELVWLALTAILRSTSPVGTAQWQYVLPKKSKAQVLDPYEAFAAKVQLMANDMLYYQDQPHDLGASMRRDDARFCDTVAPGWADLVITSPPYANNYDYADATRLEMAFWGQVSTWGDLQEVVRQYLITSCTQHAQKDGRSFAEILQDPLLAPIREEMHGVCTQLAKVRETHGGKKPYHIMIAAYFRDLAHTWVALRRVTAEGALVCFVIGDSAPYGVYVPVERWLGELAIAAGFHAYSFEKTRDRNVKWKNRKHDVPLQEGRLWVRG